MPDALDHGITVTEIAAMDQPVDLSAETVCAFVGRTLRGPVNDPVHIESVAEFRRIFGPTWARSALGPAVEQFFEHGGRSLWVVRVVNAARGAMLCLPAEGNALVLRAVQPGSTETLRAAVDYDGIDDDERFNLTLQRLDPDSGRIIDQELHSGLSIDPESDDFVVPALSASRLARVEAPLPRHRPEAMRTGYVDAVQRGADGSELSDYDYVGSRSAGSGIFALNGIEHVDLVYLAPQASGSDVGPTAVSAAEIYCRRRGAMLVIDPPSDWEDADAAISGVRALGYASPNLVAYFPRLVDRSAGRVETAGGAIIGLLARLDREFGSWHGLDDAGLSFRHRLAPERALDEEDRDRLIRAGFNVLSRDASRTLCLGDRSLGRGSESQRVYSSLSTRRTCLRIVNIVDHATRWAMFEPCDAALIEHVRAPLMAFFEHLAELGALGDTDFAVDCSALPARAGRPASGLSIDMRFTPYGAAPVSLTLEQSPDGLRVAGTAFTRAG